ncbi:MAG: hypothetical protein GY749_05480 [Desulfobacteraceae bacterium]|nr:hypothetical protein [Desulfobacteraceae bacterium]
MQNGIRIKDDNTGKQVAMRPAREMMPDGEDTYIQLIASASPVLTYRTLRSSVSAADSADISALSSDITANLIYIGDCSEFILFAECSERGTVTVIPLILSESLTVESVLASHTFTAGSLRRGTGNYLAAQKSWSTEGAGIVAVHIAEISAGNTIIIRGGALSEKTFFKTSPLTSEDDGHSHAGQLEKTADHLEFGLSKT